MFSHSQINITIETVEPRSRPSPGAPSMTSLVSRIAQRFPRQLPTTEAPQTDATFMRREATSIRAVNSGSRAAAAARARPPPELVWAEPHALVTHGIDRGSEAAMAILVHRIGTAAIRR
jgi:hypothetical protein